ncbi:Sec-independent protein translocase TatB [Demequina sp. B12]|uniref:Sec-independent protein translocase TatB n=1 Tax=Demequina sp. B12 TaxID=2992757 RepID=UPI00237B0B22|nr:Sec-independent protein translocase TatB [Demequina sp. B12]MDE0572645.1 Sec-independent protein translocase TatB [Demequina sp. B12]
MLGINGGELLLLVLIGIIVIGPERMPEYARQFREWVVRGRDMVNDGKEQFKSEVGSDVDWKQLDPRQYDPRRIVKEALAEPTAAQRASATSAPAGTATGAAAAGVASASAPGSTAVPPAPFDDEAT